MEEGLRVKFHRLQSLCDMKRLGMDEATQCQHQQQSGVGTSIIYKNGHNSLYLLCLTTATTTKQKERMLIRSILTILTGLIRYHLSHISNHSSISGYFRPLYNGITAHAHVFLQSFSKGQGHSN